MTTDYSCPVTEKDVKALENAKKIESRIISEKSLHKIKIVGGYVLTNDPEKYKTIAR